MPISDLYREEVRDLQACAEAERPISVKPEYLRRLRYQMFEDRHTVIDEDAAARNSVTGY